MEDLNQNEWQQKAESDANAVLLDVRTREEWDEGIIPGAIHYDIYKGQEFLDQINKLNRDKNYYVYCKAGGRSAQACNLMHQMGFPNTFNLVGGFSEWSGPVEYPSDKN